MNLVRTSLFDGSGAAGSTIRAIRGGVSLGQSGRATKNRLTRARIALVFGMRFGPFCDRELGRNIVPGTEARPDDRPVGGDRAAAAGDCIEVAVGSGADGGTGGNQA